MDEPLSKMKIVSRVMLSRSELHQLARAKSRITELESENTALRQSHGEDAARIRDLEGQIERLKAEVVRLTDA